MEVTLSRLANYSTLRNISFLFRREREYDHINVLTNIHSWEITVCNLGFQNCGILPRTIVYRDLFIHIKLLTLVLVCKGFWLIWYSTKRAYVIMIFPSCIVVVWRWHLCTALLATGFRIETSYLV